VKPKLLTTLADYSGRLFLADLFAGITVALVAMPLSIAIAIASGATPAVGLVTAVIGGFIVSALGGSRVQIGGPTGAFIVVVYGVIANHGYSGLVLATAMAGLILMVGALCRAGKLMTYIPEAVIEGFTVGIAIIIGVSQLKDLLGETVPRLPAEFIPKLETLWAARDTLNIQALGIGLAAMVLIVLFRRLAPRLPGLIVAVALTSAMVTTFHLPVDTIASRYGDLPAGLPMPRLPDFDLNRVLDLLPSAMVIAFLAGIESLLSAIVADRMIGGAHRPNAELMAQGVANLASAMFGGLPATGAIARTATNVRAGGKTPMAGIIHALVILLVLVVAAPLAGYLAMPALAGLLLVTAWNMSEPHRWPERLSGRLADQAIFFVTLILTLLADLTVAIAVGTGLGLALRIFRGTRAPEPWSPPEH
jgi:SulP family sulfate permease